MNFLNFVIMTVIQLYTAVLLLRVWMQCVRADFYNPFSQFVVKITQPIIRPLRSIIPSIGSIDTASVLLAYVLILLSIIVPSYLSGSSIPYSLVLPYAFIELLTTAGKIVFWLIIIRAILSWISQGRNPIDRLLFDLTEPLMSPIRRIIPAMGGLDFSAMIVLLILYALNYLRVDILQWLFSVTLY
ncbi:YggT family protein [Proteus myxofaciens]|uniref:Integral membrane protein n=1 Tax=Proteus myxofaciens ATCC 19692 TaxID=1354337 RepID=A0A198FIY1_9GAMM|nr:YggT family protein [Proteus myxofaciens]OAT24882.1 integral membrane protein [Proteus myxofaciens ATCC 19692]